MGGIIVDGRASLRYKGPISEFEKAIVGIRKLQKALGPETLMIDTVPLPESPRIMIGMRFNGPLSEFEKVIVGLEKLRASIAINTVPVPERLMIGTWPTPDKPTPPFQWVVGAHTESNEKEFGR